MASLTVHRSAAGPQRHSSENAPTIKDTLDDCLIAPSGGAITGVVCESPEVEVVELRRESEDSVAREPSLRCMPMTFCAGRAVNA